MLDYGDKQAIREIIREELQKFNRKRKKYAFNWMVSWVTTLNREGTQTQRITKYVHLSWEWNDKFKSMCLFTRKGPIERMKVGNGNYHQF